VISFVGVEHIQAPDLSRNRPSGFGGFHIDENAVYQELGLKIEGGTQLVPHNLMKEDDAIQS
jgi:hypothetical protein